MSISLDQELPVKEQPTLASHLGQCAPCREAFQELRETRRSFTLAEQFNAPPGFSRRVMAGLEPAAPGHFSSLFFVRFAEAGVLFLVIGIGVLFGHFWEPAPGPPRQPSLRAELARLSLDLFDPAPAGSLSGAYLAMTEVRDEQ